MHGRRGARRPPSIWALVCFARLAAEARELNAVDISLGGTHCCGILEDGSTKCWGNNMHGILGYGDTASRGGAVGEMGDNLPFVDFGTGRTAVHISAGSLHRCAILDDGSTKCWGKGSRGALGYGDRETRGDSSGEMGDNLPAVDLGTNRTAVKLSSGDTHNCAILDNGRVKCWGGGAEGQLGYGDVVARGDDPDEMGDALPYVDLGTGRTAVDLATGDYHTCALLDNGDVKCFGDNQEGELGYGDTQPRGRTASSMGDNLPAVDLGTGRTATSLSAGWYHSCAILDNSDLKCWGYGSYGQLGAGNTDWHGSAPGDMGDALPPIDLGTGRYAVQTTSGAAFSCARLDNGDTKCWGSGAYGQLGYEDSGHRGGFPGQMGDNLPAIDFGTGRRALHLASADLHSCALLDDGATKCWGYNSAGQLGLESRATRGNLAGTMGDSLPAVSFGGVAPTKTTTTATTTITQTATTTTSSTVTATTATSSTSTMSSTTSSTSTATNTTTATSTTTTTTSSTSTTATATASRTSTATATTSRTATSAMATSSAAAFTATSSATAASTTTVAQVGTSTPSSATVAETTVSSAVAAMTSTSAVVAPAATTLPVAVATLPAAATTATTAWASAASSTASSVASTTAPAAATTASAASSTASSAASTTAPVAAATAPATTTTAPSGTTALPTTTSASNASTTVGSTTIPQVNATAATSTAAAAPTPAPWPPLLLLRRTTTSRPEDSDDHLVSAAPFRARTAAVLLATLPLALAALTELQPR